MKITLFGTNLISNYVVIFQQVYFAHKGSMQYSSSIHVNTIALINRMTFLYLVSHRYLKEWANFRKLHLNPRRPWALQEQVTFLSILCVSPFRRVIMVHTTNGNLTFIFTKITVINMRPGTSHYSDVIISPIASQTAGVSIVYSSGCPGVDQRKHQSATSLACVRGIHQWPVNSRHEGTVTRKCFHLMTSPCWIGDVHLTGSPGHG